MDAQGGQAMHDAGAAGESKSEGESGGFFERMLGFGGTAAHALHHPFEIFAHQAAQHAEHLSRLTEPFAEGVLPGGLRGAINPEMAAPWADALKGTGRAGQVPTGPFQASNSQWQEILAADAKASGEAGEALAPATSKATTMGRVSNGLSLLVAAEAAHHEYKHSAAQTTPGKVVDAGLAGATNFALTKTPLALVDAGMGLVGSGLSWGGEKLGVGGMHDAGEFLKHNKPGHTLAAGLGGAVTAAEGMITGDSTGMEKWDKESREGKHGIILQGYSEIGNAMASSKVMDQVFDWICD
jgi:hypothetical protein